MFRIFQHVFLIPLLLTHSVVASPRWHTSQHALMQLYNLQKEHFDVFNDYLNLEENRLKELKSNLDEMYEWNSYLNDSDSLNHINYMKMMKHIQHQLRIFEDLMFSKKSTEVFKKIDGHKYINEDQISNAYGSLRRLQRFYMIPASDMAEGRRNNQDIGDPMNACECYVMTKHCFKEQDMYCVFEWTIQTYNKWKDFGQPKCVDIKKLHFYLISSSAYTGFDFTTVLNPNELQTSVDTEKYKRFFLMRREYSYLFDSRDMVNIFGSYEFYFRYSNFAGSEKFRNLCLNNAPTRILTKYSKCRYQTRNSPHRLLMPFKEEDVNNDPYVKIYHDVLYDSEISNFKKFAMENMRPAEVVSLEEGNIVVEERRTGGVCRLLDDTALQALDARTEAFTGYSMEITENYQIVNYGLGGHYVPHLDAFGPEFQRPAGDRLITVLFYMCDVPNDGSTVFPLLDIVSPAEKGAAIVWCNLNLTDGNKLKEVLHGACPILKGNKWIVTRWLLEDGQNLNYNWRERKKMKTI